MVAISKIRKGFLKFYRMGNCISNYLHLILCFHNEGWEVSDQLIYKVHCTNIKKS